MLLQCAALQCAASMAVLHSSKISSAPSSYQQRLCASGCLKRLRPAVQVIQHQRFAPRFVS